MLSANPFAPFVSHEVHNRLLRVNGTYLIVLHLGHWYIRIRCVSYASKNMLV